MTNIVDFDNKKGGKDETRTQYEQRKAQVNRLMMESVSFLQNEIARLEEVEALLETRTSKMSVKRAKNLLIDAALLSCNAVSEEFDKSSTEY